MLRRFIVSAAVVAALVVAPAARAYEYFFEDFSGSALDAGRWDVRQAISGMRWCSSTVEAHVTNPGVWLDPSTTTCHGVGQQAPYGSVALATDPDGTTGASFSSAYPNVTFPYLAAGPGHPASPFPPQGDFVLEVRMRYDALNGHGDGLYVTGSADPTPLGNNPPGPAGKVVGGFWGDVSVYRPVGVWQTYRLEYVGGVYTASVDGVQQGQPFASDVRAATLWLGNPVITFWGTTPWSPFTVDFVRVTIPEIAVEIDVKPGSDANTINLGANGVVPVAILSSATFDASTVDPASVTLASAPVRLKGNGLPQASLQDVNGDGLPDLIVQVSTAALALSSSDTEAVLEGKTYDGTPIRGTGSVRIVP
jgi:hypothetical protein